MTLALLTRIGGLIIAFQSSDVLVTWEIIICPTLQFSVSSCTTTSRRVLCTDSSIAALSQGTMERRSMSSTLISLLRSEEHTSELQSRSDIVCRLLLEKKKLCVLIYIS